MIGGELVVKDGVQTHVSRFPMGLAIVAALAVAALCGLWNGLLVAKVGMQPIIATLILMVAGRGVAQLLTGGQIITVYYAPFFFLGNGFLLGLPFAVFIAAAVWGALHLLMTRTALGPVHPGDRHQPGGGAPGRPARAADHGLRLRLLRLRRRRRGPDRQLEREERRRQQRRHAAGARRDPRGHARRHRCSPAGASASPAACSAR